MEETLDIESPRQKVYNDRAIWAATFLGGPLAGGYLIAENFKAFNEPGKARKTWIYCILATIVAFGIAFSIPEDAKIPNSVIPLIYTAIAYGLVQALQGPKIREHINSGGQLFGWGRTLVVGLIGLLITLIPLLGFYVASENASIAATETRLYGNKKHEITFDTENISRSEADKIARGLERTGFFNDSYTRYVYPKKVGTSFEISISWDKSIVNDTEGQAYFTQLRNDLQTLFPDNKIVLNLVVDDLDNVVKRLE